MIFVLQNHLDYLDKQLGRFLVPGPGWGFCEIVKSSCREHHCCCFCLPLRGWRQTPIADSTTHCRHKTLKIRVGSNHNTFLLRTDFHSTQRVLCNLLGKEWIQSKVLASCDTHRVQWKARQDIPKGTNSGTHTFVLSNSSLIGFKGDLTRGKSFPVLRT